MVFSSYIMWYGFEGETPRSSIALLLGFASCGAFAAELRWLV
jgi:hypothetical protein